LWQKNNVFPPETLQSLLQLDGSGVVSSGVVSTDEAVPQQDNLPAANSASFAGALLVMIYHFSSCN